MSDSQKNKSMEATKKEMIRTEKGRFLPGKSGNPAGRPKGSKNKITLLKQELETELREFAAPQMREVLAKAFELAQAGDRSMIKLLLELHMSKNAHVDAQNATEKVEIKIGKVENQYGSKSDPITVEAEVIEHEG